MEDIKIYIEKYNQFGKEKPPEEQPLNHMNCAEVLLRAADETYALNLDEDSFKMLQGFGGGFYSERTCGAFSGALAALGMRYTEERPSKQEKIIKAAKCLVKEFEKEFGSIDCDEIKTRYRDPVEACNPVKIRAGEALARVIKTMDNKKEGVE
ncbi:MAG: C-GCAxxG-C-C family protein [Eubacteriaceae bacterium]